MIKLKKEIEIKGEDLTVLVKAKGADDYGFINPKFRFFNSDEEEIQPNLSVHDYAQLKEDLFLALQDEIDELYFLK